MDIFVTEIAMRESESLKILATMLNISDQVAFEVQLKENFFLFI